MWPRSTSVTGSSPRKADGAYAEYCVAPADFCAYVPDAVSPDAAASSLLKGMTAHYLIKSVYPVQQGDTVLVHAGAGGVGLILTQWATSLAVRVITTVSTPEKAELSRQAGAVEVLDYPEDPAGVRRQDQGPHRRRVSPRCTTGSAQPRSRPAWPACAVRGTLALFGASSGPVPPFDPQRLNTAGSVFLTRPNLAHYTRTADEFAWRAGELLDAIAAGTITVTVSEHYRLEDAEQAHRDLQGRKTVGSVVLVP